MGKIWEYALDHLANNDDLQGVDTNGLGKDIQAELQTLRAENVRLEKELEKVKAILETSECILLNQTPGHICSLRSGIKQVTGGKRS